MPAHTQGMPIWEPRAAELGTADTHVGMPGRERDRRARLTSVSQLLAQAVVAGAGLVTVPLVLAYLGTERYSLLVVTTSLMALLALGDLGVGNALVNIVAEDQARAAREATVKAVAAAAFIVGLAAGILALFAVFVSLSLPWAVVFQISPQLQREASISVMAAALITATTTFVGLAQHVRRGYQEGYVNAAFAASAGALSVAAVLIVIRTDFGVVGMVGALLGVPLLVATLNAALLFRDRPWLWPSRSALSRSSVLRLVTPGLQFLVYQAGLVLAWTSLDVAIASRVAGPSAAAEYAIALKLLIVPVTAALAYLMPLWPAYRDALVRGEIDWVDRTLRASMRRTSLFMILCGVAIVAAADAFVPLWIGSAVQLSAPLLVGLAVWALSASLSTACAVVLVALGRVAFLVRVTIATAIAHVLLSFSLGSAYGSAGVAWGTATAVAVAMLLPQAIYLRHSLRPSRASDMGRRP